MVTIWEVNSKKIVCVCHKNDLAAWIEVAKIICGSNNFVIGPYND